ncbi:hypothetical protein GALL_454830 [mine drainage metagenome]|uniref:Uncharacterized protein n=1 Tax=mine drainage metagenome TaxID=410659 RepID=A0A1J5PQ04_9ZZZZ
MQQRHSQIKRDDHGDLAKPAGQDIPGQYLLEMFGSLRSAVNQQDRSGRRNDVDDADEGFLRHARGPGARERQQHRRQ